MGDREAKMKEQTESNMGTEQEERKCQAEFVEGCFRSEHREKKYIKTWWNTKGNSCK